MKQTKSGHTHEISIVAADKTNALELALLNRQLIEDEKHDNPMTVPQLRERMENFLSGDYTALFLKDGENNTLGYALVNKVSDPVYLRQFFICRNERRKGYGRLFFNKLLKYFNTDTVDIEVMVWNEAGRSFWENLGFMPRSVYMRHVKER